MLKEDDWYQLAPDKVHAIINGMRVAALQYAIDAQACKDVPRLHQQFLGQSRQALEIADDMENAI